ncbi:MAG: hypothetical protein PVG11_07960, partial [Anaerolineae bacterium]
MCIARGIRSFFLLAGLALVLAACAATATPIPPSPTPPMERSTATAAPTPPPAGPQRYTSARWGISFDVPATWQEREPDHLEEAGSDGTGFARLEPFDGPGVRVDQACEWEANAGHERYGTAPGLVTLMRDNAVDAWHYPCLIEGEEGPGHHSAIVLQNPVAGASTPPFLRLSVDRAHAAAIARSLDWGPDPTPGTIASGSSFGRTLAPDEVPDDILPETLAWGALKLEAYAIVDAGVDAPGHLEFTQRIPDPVLARREAWRGRPRARRPLDPVVVAGRQVTVRDVGYEVPALDGETMTWGTYVSVQVDGQEVYRYNMLQHAAVFPLYYLGNWDGRWVMEANGILIVDGQTVNQAWGCDEIFGAQLLDGETFYFCATRDGVTHLSHGGETVPVTYDYVYHGMCCEPAAFN